MSREELASSVAGNVARRIMEEVIYALPPGDCPEIEERLRSPILAALLAFGMMICAEREGVLIHADDENLPF